MNEFWTNFFSQYASNQRALFISNDWGRLIQLAEVVYLIALCVGSIVAFIKLKNSSKNTKNAIEKAYMLVGILALGLVLLVFFNSRYAIVISQNNHYIEVGDSSIMSMKSFQNLSGSEKEMVFKTFELSKVSRKDIRSDEGKIIYDLHKLKELSNVDVF